MSQTAFASRDSSRPYLLFLLAAAGLIIGYSAVELQKIDILALLLRGGLRFRVFTIGTLTLFLLVLLPRTRRLLTDRLGDDISVPVFIAIASIQLSGLKVGLATVSSLAAIPLLFYWFENRAFNPNARFSFTPFGALLLLYVVCTVWSGTGGGYFLTVYLVKLYLKFIAAIVLIDLLDSREAIKKMLMISFGFLGLNMIVATIQQALSLGFNIHLSVASKGMAFRAGALASTGLAQARNIFGQTSAVFLVMLILICATQYSRSHRRWMIPLVVLSLIQIYLSYSRGAWAALAVGLLVVPIALRPAATPFILPTYAFGGLVAWFSGLGERVITSAVGLFEQSVDARFLLMQSGAEVFAANVWRGVGMMAFARVDPAPSTTTPVHNVLFNNATGLGIPGALVFIGMMIWIVFHLIMAISVTTDLEFKAYLGAVLAGFLALCAALQVNAIHYTYFVIITFAVAEATAAAAIREEKMRRMEARR